VHAGLHGKLPTTARLLEIETGCADIRYFTPQRIAIPQSASDFGSLADASPGLQLRFSDASRGELELRADDAVVASRHLRARAETRQLLELPLAKLFQCEALSLHLTRRTQE